MNFLRIPQKSFSNSEIKFLKPRQKFHFISFFSDKTHSVLNYSLKKHFMMLKAVIARAKSDLMFKKLKNVWHTTKLTTKLSCTARLNDKLKMLLWWNVEEHAKDKDEKREHKKRKKNLDKKFIYSFAFPLVYHSMYCHLYVVIFAWVNTANLSDKKILSFFKGMGMIDKF